MTIDESTIAIRYAMGGGGTEVLLQAASEAECTDGSFLLESDRVRLCPTACARIEADTTATLTSSANPSVSCQSVTFTATVAAVAPGGGTPTGTIDFFDGGTTLLGSVTLSGGQATLEATTFHVFGRRPARGAN